MKYVYLIQVDGTEIYKIGYTKSHPQKRLEALQTGNPHKLILVDFYPTLRATKIEAAMHNMYSSCKADEYNGERLLGEWFNLNWDTRRDFKIICERMDNNFKVIEETSTLYNKKPNI
jgi:hypothetical protein